MDVRKSARCVSGYPVTLFKPVGFLALLLLLIFFGSGRVYAQDDDLTVIVDGRQVAVEAVEEAELDGRPASLDEVLAALGPDPVVAQQIVVVLPPFNDPLPSDGVEAVIEGRELTLTNLDQTLAAHGQVRIWIGGTNWRICILIRWASELNPHVTVDGRVADVNELTAEFGGSDVEYEELLELLGSTVYTDTTVELFDAVSGTTIPPDGVAATVQGNTIAFTGLTQELAARGRIGIWVSTSKWRVCVVISWSQTANPVVTVDGQETAVESLTAQMDGTDVDYARLLTLLGDEAVTDTVVELFDPADNSTIPSDGVAATVAGNEIDLTGLSQMLAARGRVGVWVSGTTFGVSWRVCVVVSWKSAANPVVTVDGQETAVESLAVKIDGVDAGYDRLLALIGSDVISDTVVELFDPADNSTIPSDGVAATVAGNEIDLTGLSQQLAARARVGVWVSGTTFGVSWRVCVVVSWKSAANPVVTVDGQETAVESLAAQIDGVDAGYDRLLALIGTDVISDTVVELFDPADNSTIPSDGVAAAVAGNEIDLTGLSQQLAARGRVGVWVSGTTFGVSWRVCVVVSWNQAANPVVTVDGQEVEVESLTAQMDGTDVDYARLLTLLGDEAVTDTTVELFDPADNSTISSDGMAATVAGNEIDLTGLSQTLAARGRVGVWVSGTTFGVSWRVCVVVSWNQATNPVVTVDGQETAVESLTAQIDGVDAGYDRLLALIGSDVISDTIVELFDPADNSTIPSDGVAATVDGNEIDLTGLSQMLAARGRVGVWVSGTTFGILWRVCVVVSWNRAANPVVTVDSQEAAVENLTVQIDGVDMGYDRLLALIGADMMTDTVVELFDPADNSTIPSDGVAATVAGNKIDLTGLSQTLAARGRVGVWVSGTTFGVSWRVCVVVSWNRAANPLVTVDGRHAAVESLSTESDGVPIDPAAWFDAIAGDVSATTVELFDPDDESPISATGVEATVNREGIALTGLSQQLAARGRIGIWVSTSNWRVCVVITWGSALNPVVMVDGREMTAESLTAEIDGSAVDYGRVLALLGDTPVTNAAVELFDPADNSSIPTNGASATVDGNEIVLTGLANQLAARGRIGVWVSTSKWRICVVITWGSVNNPLAVVDGREVTAYNAEASMDGVAVEPSRVLALLGDASRIPDQVEVVTLPDNSPLPLDDVAAVVDGDTIFLLNLDEALTLHGRLGVWVSGTTFGVKWRICVVVTSGRFTSDDERVTLDFAASQVHTNVIVTHVARANPTQPTPVNTAALLGFQLTAENGDGLPITRFDRSYVIRIAYTDQEVAAAGIDERTLQLAYWDEEGQEWVTVPTQIDAINNVAIGTLDHMTEFVIWGTASGSSGQSEIWLPIVNR